MIMAPIRRSPARQRSSLLRHLSTLPERTYGAFVTGAIALVNAPHVHIVTHGALAADFRLDINCLSFHFIELSNFDYVYRVAARGPGTDSTRIYGTARAAPWILKYGGGPYAAKDACYLFPAYFMLSG